MRKAGAEAVKAAESTWAFAKERDWARQQLEAKSLPFKPLPAAVEAWKISYDELEERYKMFVLFGPSRLATLTTRFGHTSSGHT